MIFHQNIIVFLLPPFKMIRINSVYGNKNVKWSSTLTNVTGYPSHEIKHQ